MALLGRAVCNLGFIERPLAIGLAWWLITGQAAPALPLAIFFEIFWLDLFPIGGYIPPMASFPYILLMGLAAALDWRDAASLALPLALSLPLAHAVSLYEGQLRKHFNNGSEALIQKVEAMQEPGSLPASLLVKFSVQYLGLGLTLLCLLYGLAAALLHIPQMRAVIVNMTLDVDWPVLYAIAAIGALLSLRIRKLYLAFALAMAAFVLIKAL